MKRYAVSAVRQIRKLFEQEATFEVEANSEEEAREKAEGLILNDYDNCLDWADDLELDDEEFIDAEIVEMEEQDEVPDARVCEVLTDSGQVLRFKADATVSAQEFHKALMSA